MARVKYVPGKGFIKNFFKVYGPADTIRGAFFFYYSQLRFKRLKLLHDEPYFVKVNGYTMRIIPNDYGISAELFLFNTHEPLTTKVLSRELKEGMTCLDIGSNIGYYALLERQIVGTAGKIFALEPSPLNYHYLQMNLNLQNENASNTLLYNIAAGDNDGKIDFFIGKKSNLCRVINENEKVDNEDGKIVTVPVKKIDTLMSEESVEQLNLIRMDPEGYETKIYKGMKSTINRFKPMLLIEFHRNYLGLDRTLEFLKELKEDGYDSKYYIPRWMDNPLIANSKHIQQVSIADLMKKGLKDALPAGFNLLLAYS